MSSDFGNFQKFPEISFGKTFLKFPEIYSNLSENFQKFVK